MLALALWLEVSYGSCYLKNNSIVKVIKPAQYFKSVFS